jgi:hypothetical protein
MKFVLKCNPDTHLLEYGYTCLAMLISGSEKRGSERENKREVNYEWSFLQENMLHVGQTY